MAAQVVETEFKDLWTLVVLSDDETITTIDIGKIAGPGVWRRVLKILEAHGIEDRNHVLPAWQHDLIGDWHY